MDEIKNAMFNALDEIAERRDAATGEKKRYLRRAGVKLQRAIDFLDYCVENLEHAGD